MADSIFQPMRFTIDLDSALVTQTGCGQLIYGDKSANVIEVKVQRGGKEIDLTGVTATGAFYRPVDGAEVPLPGAISANVVSVQLIDECYETEGHYEAEVKLSQGEVRRTILSIVGYVHRAGSGAVVNVTGVVPSIPELLAQISAMDAAAERANTAAARAEALAINANGYAQNAKQLDGKSADKYQLVEDACTMELLWENASPTSEFAAQDLAVNMTGYSHVAVEWLGTNLDTYEKFSIFHVGGAGDGVQYQFQPSINYAAITVRAITNKSITHIAVRTCNRWYCANGAVSMTADVNTEMIPLRIYGIKGWKK